MKLKTLMILIWLMKIHISKSLISRMKKLEEKNLTKKWIMVTILRIANKLRREKPQDLVEREVKENLIIEIRVIIEEEVLLLMEKQPKRAIRRLFRMKMTTTMIMMVKKRKFLRLFLLKIRLKSLLNPERLKEQKVKLIEVAQGVDHLHK